MKTVCTLPGLFVVAALTVSPAIGQTPASTVPDLTNLSPQQAKAYESHVAQASTAAQGVAKNILNLCTLPKPSAGGPGGAGGGGPARPAAGSTVSPPLLASRVFDNLYFVGLRGVSAWAIQTSAGIILIDALNETKDAEETIIPSMKELGLDPTQIKYLIVTHAHGDHFGSAQYFADKYHTRIISSEADWQLMAAPPEMQLAAWRSPPPKRDMTIKDGEKLTLGDTTLTLYVTPGHTPGTISMVLPVKDNGRPHMAALWGGTAFNFKPLAENFQNYANSADRFRAIARTAGADIILSNHPFVDDTLVKLEALKTRTPDQPNPYVVGPAIVEDFFTVAGECAKARLAAL